MAKRYYWLKVKEDFFRNKLIKKLRMVAGGDTYTIIYLKMQLLSLENEGVIIYDGLEDTFSKELALQIDEDEVDIDFLIHFLRQSGVIKEYDENEFTLLETVQSIGSEGASAERVRIHREKEKQIKLNAPKKKLYMDYVKLFETEYNKLVELIGEGVKTDEFIERLNNYIGSSGKKYKSHYHTIRNWYNKDSAKSSTITPMSEYE